MTVRVRRMRARGFVCTGRARLTVRRFDLIAAMFRGGCVYACKRNQLKASALEACARAESAMAAERMLTSALKAVRRAVGEEKKMWLEELREARNETARLRVELARVRANGGDSRSASTDSIYVFADDASSSSGEDEASMEDQDSATLREAAEALRALSITLCDAASERKTLQNVNRTPKSTPESSSVVKRQPFAGETARRTLRARHAMRAVNYTEPSLKVKMRRQDVPDSIAPIRPESPRPKSPAEIFEEIPRLAPESAASSVGYASRPRRSASVGVDYTEPDLVRKMRRT